MSDFQFIQDSQDRSILVGLTFDETQFILNHRLEFIRTGSWPKEDKERFRELMTKHELHLFQSKGAESSSVSQ